MRKQAKLFVLSWTYLLSELLDKISIVSKKLSDKLIHFTVIHHDTTYE